MRIIDIDKLKKEKFLEKQCLKSKLSLGIKRPVYCVSTKETFLSIGDACKRYGLNPTSVSCVCRKKQRQTKGLVFEYVFDKGI